MRNYRLIKSLAVFCLMLAQCHSIAAQTEEKARLSWDDFVQSLYDEGNEYDEDVISDLYDIYQHPFELNSATAQQLQQLPFLTTAQVLAILDYVKRNHPVLSVGELMYIRELDYPTRMKLLLFCYVDTSADDSSQAVSLRNLLRYSKNEFIVRSDIPLYTKEGFKPKSDSILMKYPNRVYQGTRYYHSFRYRFESMQHLFAGLQMEKDVGEKGVDYVAGYVMLQKIGMIQKLVAGDYKLSFGQGLVVNNSMSFGKVSYLASSSSINRGISKHSSMSETNHFRGLATTLRLSRHLNLSAFVSYQAIDGTIATATIQDQECETISSLKQDGLHRTILEKSKKGNVKELSAGGNVQYVDNSWSVGITTMYTHLSVPLFPKHNTESSLYRLYNPQGNDFNATGVNYSFRHRRFSFMGETAFALNYMFGEQVNQGVATTNILRYTASSNTSLVLLQRYYDKRYATLYANSFGENSSPQNESGLFAGVKSQVFSRLYLEAYLDCFAFPYRKYQVSDKSNGIDGSARATYVISDKSTLMVNYRIKSKQKDYKVENDAKELHYYTNQNLKIQYNRQFTPVFSTKTILYGTYIFNPDVANEHGFMLSQNIRFASKEQSSKRIDLMLTYFKTTSYNSRVYLYEPSLTYSSGMTSQYGHGMRFVLLLSYPIVKNLYVTGKASMSKYFNRDTIGSSLDKINASHREDIQLQLRWVL